MFRMRTFIVFLTLLAVALGNEKVCPIVLPNAGNSTSSNTSTVSNTTRFLSTTSRIVNGLPAPPSTLQYLVAIIRNTEEGEAQYCSGSLISSTWVLSAAHCKIQDTDIVRIGGVRAFDGVKINITKVYSHEDFKRETLTFREIYDDDIAVIKLSQPAPSTFVPVLINTNNRVPDPPGFGRVAGYGITGFGSKGTGGIARFVDVPSVSSARCSAFFAGVGKLTGFKIKDRLQYCAGYKQGNCDSCQGDSGGPMILFDPQNRPVQIGLTSFGQGCARRQRPGIYTRVSGYIDWMREQGAEFRTSTNGVKVSDGKDHWLDRINPLCFPEDATVSMKDGAIKLMKDINVGDEVMSSYGEGYSKVFMFTHRILHGTFEFIEIQHDKGNSITLSPGHYLYVKNELKMARDVKLGDELSLGDGTTANVKGIRSVQKRGLYNPQTLSGSIVVNGVKASVYTKTIPPMIAHGLLRPLSAIFKLFGRDPTLSFFDDLSLI